MDRLLNRRALGAAAAAGMIGVTAPNLGAQEATPDATSALKDIPKGGLQADGTWAFTDDLGNTVSLPEAPTRVVAFVGYAAALHAYGFDVVGYYGGAVNEDGSNAPVAGDLPLDSIPSIAMDGDDYAIDIEKVINVDAQVFVGPNYSLAAEPPVIWPLDADAMAQLGEVVEMIHIAADDGADVERNIQTLANLAEALGVDPESPEVADARAEYETARDALAEAIASRPNLTTLWMSGYASGFWIGSTNDVDFLANLGMQRVGDDLATAGEQSWETFPQLEADLIFNDDRPPYWWGVEQLTAEIPTYSLHPAVAAGQVASWHNTFVPSYSHFTPIIDGYTKVFLDADETVVS